MRRKDGLMTLTEAALIANVSTATLRRHAIAGTLDAEKRTPRLWLVTAEALDEWKRNKALHRRGPKPPKIGG